MCQLPFHSPLRSRKKQVAEPATFADPILIENPCCLLKVPSKPRYSEAHFAFKQFFFDFLFHLFVVTNLLMRSRQVPLFLQGPDKHSLTSTSQSVPVKPCWQEHLAKRMSSFYFSVYHKKIPEKYGAYFGRNKPEVFFVCLFLFVLFFMIIRKFCISTNFLSTVTSA